MNLEQALAAARARLAQAAVDDYSLEAEVLLRHVLGIDRAQLFTEIKSPLSAACAQHYDELVARRISGEPTAYITGHREFYGLDFIVGLGVLIPRPETELLVEKAIEYAGEETRVVADIGTGSGAIAVCLARNLPQAAVYAVDVSPEALAFAGCNCERHGVAERVTLLQGDLLKPLPQKPDMIVANLPYVPRQDIPPEGPISHEPVMALDGGVTGLDFIERLCRQAAGVLKNGGSLLLEIGQGQDEAVLDILHNVFPDNINRVFNDLAGIPRVAGSRLTQHGLKC